MDIAMTPDELRQIEADRLRAEAAVAITPAIQDRLLRLAERYAPPRPAPVPQPLYRRRPAVH